MGKPVFECSLTDDDLAEWFEIEAYDAESAARGFIQYLDSRDSEYFPRADVGHEVAVRSGGNEVRFSLSFDYEKCWRARRVLVSQPVNT